jgi:hypothetical protein
MLDFVAYAGFLDFWSRHAPSTPFGRDAHEKMETHFDALRLEATYDQTDALLSMLGGAGGYGSREALISSHLKHLPRLPLHGQRGFDEIEIFQVKKFLHNYRWLADGLPEGVRALFGLEFHSQKLEETLGRGGQGAEAFYIADAYSPDLAAVRAAILETDARARDIEEQRAAEIRGLFGLDFRGRSFLVVPKEALGDRASASRLMDVEPYDDAHFCVLPLKPAALLDLQEKRLELARLERLREGEVLESVSAEINAEAPSLLKYRDAALAFDLAWARARAAHELGLTRPRLSEGGPIRIAKGRFPPCESDCMERGVPYAPLDATFGPGATVVFGSNMGGKTVALQTAAFLQLAAQAGLFVPADAFETRVFRSFHYIGEGRGDAPRGGLSGFGVEMRQLMGAWRSVCQGDGDALLLMDEFARTTGSAEAEAILAAVLEAVSQKPSVVALCSTHFHGLPRIQGVRYLRMSGLKKEPVAKRSFATPTELVGCIGRARFAAPDDAPEQSRTRFARTAEWSGAGGNQGSARGSWSSGEGRPGADGTDGPAAPGADPIAEIARAMTYRLEEDCGRPASDAIAVARMLGLDEGLAKRAEFFWGKAIPLAIPEKNGQ